MNKFKVLDVIMRKHYEALGLNLASLDILIQKLRVDHPNKWEQ